MGWINTILNVADLSVGVYQAGQLQRMNEQQSLTMIEQLGAAARQAIRQAARNELFAIK